MCFSFRERERVNDHQTIRYGCCDLCGYCGYIDRPAKEWIEKFYSKFWKSSESDLTAEEEIEKQKAKFSLINFKEKEEYKRFAALLAKIKLDKDRYICEIGCGHGNDLAFFKSIGFNKVAGIENSRNRAEIASKVHGIKILNGSFEDGSVQSELAKLAPFGLLFSRHVLEHVYDPGETIKLASSLQKEGDYFINILPNGLTEAPMTKLLYLPHLHSFSKNSLASILNNNGYQIVYDLTDEEEIFLVAKKDNKKSSRQEIGSGNFKNILAGFIRDLGLNKRYLTSSLRLWWGKNTGPTLQSLYFQNKLLDRVYCRLILKIAYLKYKPFKYHSCLITNSGRYARPEGAPLEIQFLNKIKLIYK